MEKQGFDVVQKRTGQQALDALDSEAIDLVLMDIEMPIMDGVRASRLIRSANRSLDLRYRLLRIRGQLASYARREWSHQACRTLL
ncbi:response regulator [Vibrio chagasii]|nr:response regulator [Vibrio chagasii]